jgi:outer membrane lipoprotein carrier protein
MARRTIFSAVLVLLFLGAVAVIPLSAKTAPEAVPVVRALEVHYHNAKTLKAIFLERYRDARDSLQIESGTVYFSRPGRMRWEYESPERKLFIADGKTVWFFVPSDHTVTRTPMKESADWRTPLALLTGKANLSKLCDRIDLVDSSPASPGHVTLSCLPRGEEKKSAAASSQSNVEEAGLAGTDQPFDQVFLEVDRASGELADVRVLQPGGIEIEYRFGNWIENLPLEDSLFHFHTPPGVAVVDETTALP